MKMTPPIIPFIKGFKTLLFCCDCRYYSRMHSNRGHCRYYPGKLDVQYDHTCGLHSDMGGRVPDETTD